MVPYYEFQPSDINIILNHRELSYRPHIHKHIEIIYVFKLGQHIDIDGKKYEIHEGEAAVIFPNSVHTYYRLEKRPTEQIFAIISPELFNSLFPDLSRLDTDYPVITNVEDSVKLAFKELAECDDFAQRLAWSMVILTKLMKKLTVHCRQTEPVNDLVRKIITYIGNNFHEDISLEKLAEEFSVSKFYISRTFSEKIKMSLPKYLALIRAEYAAELMRTTDDSITNICINSGFASQSTFNRAFKKIYCMTPREYKGNMRKLYLKGL